MRESMHSRLVTGAKGTRDGGRGTGTCLVPLTLTTSVKYLKGVGPKRAESLARLGIRSVGDLLYHAPHRYLDATTVTPFARAAVDAEVTCVGRVVSTGHSPHAARPARVPRRAAGRERLARVRLARPAVSRAADQGRAAAARHRSGALLPRPPARAAGVHRARRTRPRTTTGAWCCRSIRPPRASATGRSARSFTSTWTRCWRSWWIRILRRCARRTICPTCAARSPPCTGRRAWTRRNGAGGASPSTSCSISSWCRRGPGCWPSGRAPASASSSRRS